MGSRLKQVSAVVIVVLLLLVLIIYLRRRSSSLTVARVCEAQTLSSGPTSPHKNGFIGKDKCCDAVSGRTLEQVCTPGDKGASLVTKDPSGCTCMDFFSCKLVVVSAISSNHMSEATEMIISVQRHMPNARLIMYSLGLTRKEMALLQSYCNLELRVFDFDKYPALAYTKYNLRKYGWKPLIVNEVAEEYELISWFDASVRLTGPIDENVFKYLQSTPAFLPGPWVGKTCINSKQPIVSYTHDHMLTYLFPNKSRDIPALRRELAVWGHLQGGVWLVWLNRNMRKRILNNWVDCALHEECLAPRDAGVDCSPIKRALISQFSPQGEYIGCHRYDQSALDLILYREFGLASADKICHDFVFKLFLVLQDSKADAHFKLLLLLVFILVIIIIFINWYCSYKSST